MCFWLVIALQMSFFCELCGAKLVVNFLSILIQVLPRVLKMIMLQFWVPIIFFNNDMFDSNLFLKLSYFQTSHLVSLKPSCSVLC